MKSLMMRRLAMMAMAGAVALTMATPSAADERVRWKMQSAYARTLDVAGDTAFRLTEDLGKASNGEFQLRFYEPNALVPPLQIVDAVSQGSIESGYTAAAFHVGKIPAAAFYSAVPFGPSANEDLAWLYFGGGNELYNEIYAEHGVRGFQCGLLAPEGGGWFRKEINSVEDLKGLKMRFLGLGAKVMEQFGVSTQLLAPGDIYPALELGTLDATELSMPSMDVKLGFHQIAKHYYLPGWQQQSTMLEFLVNLAKYDALSERNKTLIRMGCEAGNAWSLALGESSQLEALKQIEAKGVHMHRWPDSVLEEFEKAWLKVVEEESAKDANFKRVYASYAAFRTDFKAWREMGYLR